MIVVWPRIKMHRLMNEMLHRVQRDRPLRSRNVEQSFDA